MIPRTLVAAAITLVLVSCSEPAAPARDGLFVDADSTALWVGEALTLRAELRDAAGAPVAAEMQWRTESPFLAVSASGVVTASARGKGTVEVSAGGRSRRITVVALPILTGRVVAPVALTASALSAYWRAGQRIDSVRVQDDGTYSLRVRGLEDRGELVIDAPASRSFHPFLHPVGVDAADGITAVMVPLRWTIRRGIHQGQTLDISLDLVTDEPSNGLPYYVLSRTGSGTLAWYMQTWRLADFPARVVFDKRWSEVPFDAADSTLLWSVWNRMEEIYGLDLFEHAEAEEGWWPTADDVTPIRRVIRITKTTNNIGARIQSTQPEWVTQLTFPDATAGARFTQLELTQQYLDAGQIMYTSIEPPIGNRIVYAHEMLHVLGVGHTSRIPSTQGPQMRTPEPSMHDVAYWELRHEMLHLEREHETLLGVLPAMMGQRRIMLDLPLLPTLQPR